MEKIHMVDLVGQYNKIKPQVDAAIQDVINSASFINGQKVKDFAANLEKYLSVKHVIPCANGTDALQIALMALDLPKDAKVICPAFNYVATAETVALLGFTPVYVDVLQDTFEIDLNKAEEAIDEHTKVIMPVHLFGQSVNMDGVKALADKHKLYIVEDAAQSIGADYCSATINGKTGTLGDIGITSFFPSKNLGCYGDGGALFTDSDELAAKIRMIANHGQSKKYHFDCIGVNSRLDTLQAAILDEKLKHLDAYGAARQAVADHYDNAFTHISEIKTPYRNADSTHVFHQYTLQVPADKRDALKEHLAGKGVPSMIYYPIPLHLHKAYLYLGHKEGDFPIAEELCKKVISLPIHTELDEEQLSFITDAVISFFINE